MSERRSFSAEEARSLLRRARTGTLATLNADDGTPYASLVNLKDGQVVWFNAMNRPNGDLREAHAAEETVQALLRNFPRAPS